MSHDKFAEAVEAECSPAAKRIAELQREIAELREEKARLVGSVVALDTERRVLKGEMEAVKREALDEAESAARQSCHTGQAKRDYMGQVAGTLVTDSGAISTYAELLRRLAEAGRFRIVAEHGRMVVGYWPENDPQNKQEAVP